MAEDSIIFSEKAERAWRAHMTDFMEKVWPVFKEKGFTSPDVCFNTWYLNMMLNELAEHNERESLKEQRDDF